MEKLIDELAKGRKMEKILRKQKNQKIGLIEYINKNSKIVRNKNAQVHQKETHSIEWVLLFQLL